MQGSPLCPAPMSNSGGGSSFGEGKLWRACGSVGVGVAGLTFSKSLAPHAVEGTGGDPASRKSPGMFGRNVAGGIGLHVGLGLDGSQSHAWRSAELLGTEEVAHGLSVPRASTGGYTCRGCQQQGVPGRARDTLSQLSSWVRQSPRAESHARASWGSVPTHYPEQ